MKLAMVNSGLVRKICQLESGISQGRKRFFKTVKRLIKQYFVIFYISYTRIPLKAVKRKIAMIQNKMK